MNNITPEQKQPVIKTLAIGGLIGVIILIAWLAVQIVNVFPSALSSLASLANSVYTFNPLETEKIALNTSETLVNAGQPFTISWNQSIASGTYAFSYNCLNDDSLVVDLNSGGKDFANLECEKRYDLGTVNTVSLSITTEKKRFTDVGYTIDFYRANSPAPTVSQSATSTIVNPAIVLATEISTTTEPLPLVVATTTNPAPTTTPEIVPTKPERPIVAIKPPVATSTPSQTSKPTTTKPVATTPVSKPANPTITEVPVYIYEIPVSNPQGTPNLAVVYLGIGTLSKAGVFTKTNTIKAGETGAIQFSVHNIGQKTSGDWSYQANLPGGSVHSSQKEQPLLPNERAVLTIQFPAVTNSFFETFSVAVNTKPDVDPMNNSFKANAIVIK